MNNTTIQIKVKERLNKLDSSDYNNLQCWQIVEAFNKGQVEWCRRQLHGMNMFKEGDEQSIRRVDDLELLITRLPSNLFPLNDKINYWEGSLPGNYLQWKRFSAYATSECCPDPRRLVIYLGEESNLDELLRNTDKRPSFEWAETFVTLGDDLLRVYTDNLFDIVDYEFVYYRQPTGIQILNCIDPYTLLPTTVDIECEFKDDIIEVLIDECVSIIAGDIESGNQYGRGSQGADRNN